MPVRSWSALQKLLDDAMGSYNELVGAMSLVFFEDAMAHVCRINRILELPRGNALLVGVGGSGKQSLARLSAFISSLEPFQVQLTPAYGIAELKADLASLYAKAGLKSLGIMFLMTDSQVSDERFLVLINDMLASGQIPELFADDEVDHIVQTIGPEVISLVTLWRSELRSASGGRGIILITQKLCLLALIVLLNRTSDYVFSLNRNYWLIFNVKNSYLAAFKYIDFKQTFFWFDRKRV